MSTHCEECDDLGCRIEDSKDLGGLREKIFKLRYASNDHESWYACAERVARAISSVESDSKRQEFFNVYFNLISQQLFIPGGRILRNAGKVKGMLLNCFGLAWEDDIRSIMRLLDDAVVISKYGGGVGFDASPLRPKGAPLISQGNNSESSGALSFVDGVNFWLGLIRGGGDRRGAGITFMHPSHPQILDFINRKKDDSTWNNFNISVKLTNEFLNAVKKNKEWNLQFNNKTYETVKARDIWDAAVANAWNNGEPGFLNFDNIELYNPLWYCEKIVAVNPCGEIPVPDRGACDLGSVNLSEVYDEKKNDVNWKLLKWIIYHAIRFLDSVLDVTEYPTPETEQVARSTRRIGLGVMGLHYLMLKLGINDYGSKESIEFMELLLTRIRNYAYEASIELAKEKGPFAKFDANAHLEGAFVKTLPRRIRKDIAEFGLRNGTLLTMPPTGTTSLVAGVSQGIQTIFAPIYNRTYYEGGKKKQVTEVDPLFREFVLAGKDVSHFVGSYEIAPEKYLEIQGTAQQYIDNSISLTVPIANNYPEQKLNKLLLDHISDVKGVTVYREKSRGEEILTPCEYKMPKTKLKALVESL